MAELESWRDEISGAIQKLTSLSVTDESKIKGARDTLKSLAHVKKAGMNEDLYSEVQAAVLRRLGDDTCRDEWHVKYRLLQAIPVFIRKADVEVIAKAANLLEHRNAMVRDAAVDCVAHLVDRGAEAVKIPELPCSRSNSRPSSVKKMRPPIQNFVPRPEFGLVVGEDMPSVLPKIDHNSGGSIIRRLNASSKVELDKRFQASIKSFKLSKEKLQSKNGKINNTMFSETLTGFGQPHSRKGKDKSDARQGGTGGTSGGGLDQAMLSVAFGTVDSDNSKFSSSVGVSRGTTRGGTGGTGGTAGTGQSRQRGRRGQVFQGVAEENWVGVENSLLPIILEKMDNEDSLVRAAALKLLARATGPGKMAHAVRGAQKLVNDKDWRVREAALLAIRETAVTGDFEVEEVLLNALEDERREVRYAAVKAFETVITKGDSEIVKSVASIMESATDWQLRTGVKEWELREVCIRAIGSVADAEDKHAIELLKHAMGDVSNSVIQRTAAHALGQIVERVAPKDTVWTYNNATFQPARKSTHTDMAWDPRRQAYMPSKHPPRVDESLKHAPEEVLQMIETTPRGSRVPHLLTTPRMEHLYEGKDIQLALRKREKRRKEIETLATIHDAYDQLMNALAIGDDAEIERLEGVIMREAGVKSGTQPSIAVQRRASTSGDVSENSEHASPEVMPTGANALRPVPMPSRYDLI